MHAAAIDRARRLLSRPFVQDFAIVGGLLLVYRALELLVMRGYRLPADSYSQPFLLLEALVEAWPWPPRSLSDAAALLALSALIVLAARRWRRLLCRWSDFDATGALRPFVIAVAAAAAWSFATYRYNLYFDQSHWADRLLLVALAAAALRRPAASLPLAFLAVAIAGQFQHPLGGYYPTHVILPVRLLVLLAAALVVWTAGARIRARDYYFVAILLVSSGYLLSGLKKLQLGWIGYGHIHHILLSTYANGWLGFLSEEQISAIARALAPLGPLLVAGVLALEIGILLIFSKRFVAIGLLIWGAAFHMAVFALSGILFWLWFLIDAGLAAVLALDPGGELRTLFTRRRFAASLALLPIAVVWFRPTPLSWFDAPLSYTYRFEGIGESGRRYSLPPSFFSPYEYEFTVGAFDAYVNAPLLTIRWGATADPRTAWALLEAETAAEALAVERSLGRMRAADATASRIDAFLQRWISAYNRRGHNRGPWSAIEAPLQLYTWPEPDSYVGQEKITTVEVLWVTTFFDGNRYDEIRQQTVRSIAIPAYSKSDSARLLERASKAAASRP